VTAQTFKGNLVHLTIQEKLLNAALKDSKLTTKDMVELQRGRIADQLAKFLTKHFLTVTGTVEGVEIRLMISLMMPVVPKGLAHTPIIFQEYRPCPNAPDAAAPVTPEPSSVSPA
jgi:hypothetical protein